MKKPFFTAGLAGLAVILMSGVLALTFPARAPGRIAGIVTPLAAFEFSRTPGDVEQLFGPASSPARTAMIQAMDRGNYLDYLFMGCYGTFLFLFARACARQTQQRRYEVAGVLAIAAVLADALENVQLLTITATLAENRSFESALRSLSIFTWLKWGALATGLLLLSRYFATRSGRLARCLEWLGPLTFILGLGAFLHRSVLNEFFVWSMAVMLLGLIGYCLTATESPPPRTIGECST